jgi:opacity protein-like surface antigen
VYFGGNYGRDRNSYDTGFVSNTYATAVENAGDTLVPTASSVHRTSTAWFADAGYWLGHYFGVEAAFLHLGQLKYAAIGTLESSFSADQQLITGAEIISQGPALSLRGRLPLTESVEIDGRLGDYFGKTTFATVLDLGSQYSASSSSVTRSSLLVGIGASYSFGEHLSLRIDYDFVSRAGDSSTGRYNVSLPTVGLSFTF